MKAPLFIYQGWFLFSERLEQINFTMLKFRHARLLPKPVEHFCFKNALGRAVNKLLPK